MAAFLIGVGVMAGIGQGIGAFGSQNDINEKICELEDSITAVTEGGLINTALLSMQAVEARKKLSDTMDSINGVTSQMKKQQIEFRKQYGVFLLVGILLIIVASFCFIARKIIVIKAKQVARKEMSIGIAPTSLLEAI
jgi:hypothetical protein